MCFYATVVPWVNYFFVPWVNYLQKWKISGNFNRIIFLFFVSFISISFILVNMK